MTPEFTGTLSFTDPRGTGLVLLGTINGIPIYGPYGSVCWSVTLPEWILTDRNSAERFAPLSPLTKGE